MNVTNMPIVYKEREITMHAAVIVDTEVMVSHNVSGSSKLAAQRTRAQQILNVTTSEILLNVLVLK